jgi:hypothetical protein
MQGKKEMMTSDLGSAVEDWINGQDKPKKLILDPERAREDAVAFASEMSEIAELMRDSHHMHEINNQAWITKCEALNELHVEARMVGIGDGSVTFVDYHQVRDETIAILGVNSPYVLMIGLHTDEATREAIEVKLEAEEFPAVDTEYYFDSDGNYAKVSYLPVDLVDGDHVLDRSGPKDYQNQVTEMTPADFERVRYALPILRANIK